MLNFTEEMKQILIEVYPYYGMKETLKRLNLPDEMESTVSHKLSRLNIKRVGINYTEEEIKYICDNYSTMSTLEIANKLNKPEGSISVKASQLKLKKDSFYYSESDISYLTENYGKLSINEISNHLNKTHSSIKGKASRLNITNDNWSEEEIQILKDVYPIYTNKKIIKDYLPKRNKDSISTMAHKFDLVKNKEKGSKQHDKDDMLLDLQKAAEKIGRTPYTIELSQLFLPSEQTYGRFFGSYSQACILANLKPNAQTFGRTVNIIASDGTKCLSESERIVCEYLISHNIKYKKEGYYKKYINDERCGMKRCDWIVNDNFIEFFGLIGRPFYNNRMNEKIQICKDNNINLISLYPSDLLDLNKKLHILLQ